MTLFPISLKKMTLPTTLIHSKEIVLSDLDIMDGHSQSLELLKNLLQSPLSAKNRWQNFFGETGFMMMKQKDLIILLELVTRTKVEDSTNMF